ncbi:MAG TPA: FG-GAP repeat protein [Kineosporiaceae bacterium]|nr:FG-GAP repeat protein [Kineosporiaceae bacterium]
MSPQPDLRSAAPGSLGLGRLRLLGLAVVPAALILVLGTAGSAAADPPEFTGIVGIPAFTVHGHRAAGAVDLRLLAGGGQVLSEQGLGLAQGSQLDGARFGAAVVSGDLNGDGDQDMIVGAPGGAGSGRVAVLFGSSTGVSASGAQSLPVPPSLRAGDEFGASLAITFRLEPDQPGPGNHDLWVGAPGRDVAGKVNAGAVFRYLLSPAGVATYLETITQDSPLVPGSAESGDRFGAVLGGGSVRNGVVVGVPDEDIGRLKDAGTVQRIRTDLVTDVLVRGQGYNQNTNGVHGRAEAGDRFGAALSGAGSYGGHAVGVPGEDVGGARNAGAVQVFGSIESSGDDGFHPVAAFTQDSKGVPGRVEAGDRFGAALTVGDLACQDWSVTAVGSPGENIGSVRDAGSITLLPDLRPGPHHTCTSSFRQGHGLPGKAEAGDQLGATLGVLKSDLAGAGEAYDRLQIGVPGEDVGSAQNVGRVITGTGKQATGFGYQGGGIAGMRFGSILATAK